MKRKNIGSIALAIMMSTTFMYGGISKSSSFTSYGQEIKANLKEPRLFEPTGFDGRVKIVIDKDQDKNGAEIDFFANDYWTYIKKENNMWRVTNSNYLAYTLLEVNNYDENNVELILDYIPNTPKKEYVFNVYSSDNLKVVYKIDKEKSNEVSGIKESFKSNSILLKPLKANNIVRNINSITDEEKNNIISEINKVNFDKGIKDVRVENDKRRNLKIEVLYDDDSIAINPYSILNSIKESNHIVLPTNNATNTEVTMVKGNLEVKKPAERGISRDLENIRKPISSTNRFVRNSSNLIPISIGSKTNSKINTTSNSKSNKASFITTKSTTNLSSLNKAAESVTKDEKFNLVVKSSKGINLKITGKNEIDLSINASKALYKKADSVILVNKDALSDTLSSVPYANKKSSPIIYTNGSSIDKEHLDEINRLGSKEVILVGGYKTISSNLESELKNRGYKVNRLGGKDRYETNRLILHKIDLKSNKVALVSGEVFADALAVSPYSVKNNMSVILTKKNMLSNYTKDLVMKKNNEIVIFGGVNSVSNSLEKMIKDNKISVSRIAGHDRYKTSEIIAEKIGVKNGFVESNGNNEKETLIGSLVSTEKNIPLILKGK